MFEFFEVFWGVGGSGMVQMVRGTRTIHFSVPIPHIDHSRPVSISFWMSPVSFWRLRRLGGKMSEKSELGFGTWPTIMNK